MIHTLSHLIWITIILGTMSPVAVPLLSKENNGQSVEGHSNQHHTRTKSWTQSSTSPRQLNEKSQTRRKRWSPVNAAHDEAVNNRWWADAKISLLKSGSDPNSDMNSFQRISNHQTSEANQRTASTSNNTIPALISSAREHPTVSHLRVSSRSPTYFLQEAIGIPKNGLQYLVEEGDTDHLPSLSNHQDSNLTNSSKDGNVRHDFGRRTYSNDEVRERLILSRELKRRRINGHGQRVTDFLEPESFYRNFNSSTAFSFRTTVPMQLHSHNDKDDNGVTTSSVERNLLESEIVSEEGEILSSQNNSKIARSSVEYIIPEVRYVVSKADYALPESRVHYVEPGVQYIEPKVEYVQPAVEYVNHHNTADGDYLFYDRSHPTTPSNKIRFDGQTEVTSDFNSYTGQPNIDIPGQNQVKFSTHIPGEGFYYDPISPDLKVTPYEGDFELHEAERNGKHLQPLLRIDGQANFNDEYYAVNRNDNGNKSDITFEHLTGTGDGTVSPYPPTFKSSERETNDAQKIKVEIDSLNKEDMGFLNGLKNRMSAHLSNSDSDAQNIEPNVIETSRRSDNSISNFENRESAFSSDDSSLGNNDKDSVLGIRNATVFGTPEIDYPAYDVLPDTTFSCSDRRGYYGDVTTRCQVFHVCQADGRKDSFLCPTGTIFHQRFLVCDWWYNVDCDQTTKYYDLIQLYFDDEGKTDDNVNSAASYDTQKPAQVLAKEKTYPKQFYEVDLDTASGFVGGLKPFLPSKGFPVHVARYAPLQTAYHGKLSAHLKSSNVIENNHLAKLIRIGVIKINRGKPELLKEKPEERSQGTQISKNYSSMGSAERAMVQKAFSMGQNGVRVSHPPRKTVEEKHNEWWKDSDIPDSIHKEETVGNDHHKVFRNQESSSDRLIATNKSAIQNKQPLRLKSESGRKFSSGLLRRGKSRARTFQTAYNGITTTPTPPVATITTTPTPPVATIATPARIKLRAGSQRHSHRESYNVDVFISDHERKSKGDSDGSGRTTLAKPELVTFPMTKIFLPTTTEIYTTQEYRRPLKVSRWTTMFYPTTETTTERPATSPTKNVRVLKIRKHGQWGARLTKPQYEATQTTIKPDKNDDSKKFEAASTKQSEARGLIRRNQRQKYKNNREKYRNRLNTTPSSPSSTYTTKHTEENTVSKVEVRMGSKVTISMDQGGKSVSPPVTPDYKTTEKPHQSTWDGAKGSQRIKNVTPQMQEPTSSDIKTNNIGSIPQLLKNYSVSVRKVTNGYLLPSNSNDGGRKRSLSFNADGNHTRHHNSVKQEISSSGYKSNYPRNNRGKLNYEILPNNSTTNVSRGNEFTNSERNVENHLGKISVGRGGFISAKDTTQNYVMENTTPFATTTRNPKYLQSSLRIKAVLTNNNQSTVSSNVGSDIITLHKKPEVHQSFGEKYDFLNLISLQRSAVQAENPR